MDCAYLGGAFGYLKPVSQSGKVLDRHMKDDTQLRKNQASWHPFQTLIDLDIPRRTHRVLGDQHVDTLVLALGASA